MNKDFRNQQIEFDVFPKDKKSVDYAYLSDGKNDTPHQSAAINISFSHQSVIVIFICVVMSLVASFTLGVEKGKLIAKNRFIEEKGNLPVSAKPLQAAVPPENTTKPLEDNTLTVENNIHDNQKLQQETEVRNTPPKDEIASKNGDYVIQIASLKTKEGAEKLIENLKKQGIASYKKTSGKFIMVLAGNFEKEEAKIKLKELNKIYKDCFIRKM